MALTVGLIVFGQRVRHGQEQEALAQQTARAQELASELGYQLRASEQLVDTLASLAGPIQEQRELEELLRRMLPSAPEHMAYGLGVWFEPGQFSPGVRYMGPYLHQGRKGGPGILTYEWSTPAYDYPQHDWYQQAWERGGRLVLSEPFFDLDHTYVTLSRAFFDDQGRRRGVVSMDLILPMIGEVVREANVSQAETLALASPQGALLAHPREEELLAWAHGQGRPVRSLAELSLEDLRTWEHEHGLDRGWRTIEVSVPNAGWRVFASTAEDVLFKHVRREQWLVVALGLLLWVGLGASGMVMARSERNRVLLHTLAERQRQEDERRRLLAQVRRRSAELQAIIEGMVEAVVVVDAEGNVTLANRAALALFGHSSREGHDLRTAFREQSPIQGLDGQALSFEDLPLPRALRGEQVIDTEFIITLPPLHRRRVLRVNAAPIRDEPGHVAAAVAVGRDITQAIELERLQGEFVKMAAHELKTPLAVMKSFAQLACRTAHPSPALRRQLEGISRGVDRMDRVVRTLLDASQLQLGRLHFEKKELGLRTVVEAAAASTAARHPHNPIHVRPVPDAWVLGDRVRLEQVLTELMDNAARYSAAGTPVEVSVTLEAGEVELSIRDEGIGIAEDRRERVFERFYRAHAGTPHDRGGMGLGLYLARGILLLHGGRVELESRVGEGTHVRVHLPRLSEKQRAPEVAPGQTPAPPPFEPDSEAPSF